MTTTMITRCAVLQLQEQIQQLAAEQETYFTPGHLNSYRRDRYERFDQLTMEIARLKDSL